MGRFDFKFNNNGDIHPSAHGVFMELHSQDTATFKNNVTSYYRFHSQILKIYFAEMDFFLFIKLTGNVMLKCYEFAKLIKDHLTHLCMPH
jgi:hypothetical protein